MLKSPFNITVFQVEARSHFTLKLNCGLLISHNYYNDSLRLHEYTKMIGLKRKRLLFGAEKLK